MSPQGPSASNRFPKFNITVDNVRAPTECKPYRWEIPYERTTKISNLDALSLTRYFVQYINDDLNLVHYWGSGYDAYVQDYWVSAGTDAYARASATYTIPFWTDTYEAESIEYILNGDQVIWEIRAALSCENGEVTDYALTSEPTYGRRDWLPKPRKNLVLALEEIPLYSNSSQMVSAHTIKACETFYVDKVYMPRASVLVWAHEADSDYDILLFDGSQHLRIVDVAEDYGQPDGQPVLDECADKS